MVVCLAGGLVLNISLGAGNPYAPIAARNIFGLNPPQALTPPPPDPPSKITLNGIMTIFGTAQALFYVDVPRVRPCRQHKNPTFSAKARDRMTLR